MKKGQYATIPRFIYCDMSGYLEGYYKGYAESYCKITREAAPDIEKVLYYETGNNILNRFVKRIKILFLRQNLLIEHAMDIFDISEILRDVIIKRIG